MLYRSRPPTQWGVYLLVWEKEGQRPAVYVVTGTNSTLGIKPKFNNYDKGQNLSVGCENWTQKGYLLTHKALVCTSPLPPPKQTRCTLRAVFKVLETTVIRLFIEAATVATQIINDFQAMGFGTGIRTDGELPFVAYQLQPLNEAATDYESDISDEEVTESLIEQPFFGSSGSNVAYLCLVRFWGIDRAPDRSDGLNWSRGGRGTVDDDERTLLWADQRPSPPDREMVAGGE
ncbi:hypothetical protein QR685DRAFT_575684 [Neurospora intermedia]|uniref:Uncharacterized protein n=1 Tax=Neurospora intermedia TaxID=5142 RepID=A0ABR3D071_NEUIN